MSVLLILHFSLFRVSSRIFKKIQFLWWASSVAVVGWSIFHIRDIIVLLFYKRVLFCHSSYALIHFGYIAFLTFRSCSFRFACFHHTSFFFFCFSSIQYKIYLICFFLPFHIVTKSSLHFSEFSVVIFLSFHANFLL